MVCVLASGSGLERREPTVEEAAPLCVWREGTTEPLDSLLPPDCNKAARACSAQWLRNRRRGISSWSSHALRGGHFVSPTSPCCHHKELSH